MMSPSSSSSSSSPPPSPSAPSSSPSPPATVGSAPPQPPLPSDNPPIVDGIDEPNHQSSPTSSTSASTSTSMMNTISESYINNKINLDDTTRIDDEISPSTTSATSIATEDQHEDEQGKLKQVRPGDLAAFSELFSRFHSRIEKASAGRKYRPLRDVWESASDEISKYPDHIHIETISDLVIEALRLGCESGKIIIVDSCLDCIHRLFEYGHIGSNSSNNGITDIILDKRDGGLDEVVAIVCACLEVKDEDVYLRMVQTLLTAATRTKSGLHQSTLLAGVRTIYNIFLNAKMSGTRTTAKVSLTQILNLVFSRMESESTEDSPISNFSHSSSLLNGDGDGDGDENGVDIKGPSLNIEEGVDGSNNEQFVSVLQRDAYLLFRALCKLSAKEYVDLNSPDAVGIRSKILSLELIRILINNSGPVFRSGDRFIYALRQYLSRSLLINCTWNSTEVMDIAFDIFETLLRKDTLRPLLKSEISTLFDTVVFRFLESPTAGSSRKRKALALLSRLSTDRQTMADLFLNYDCDMDSPKIFERIVHVISAAAQDKSLLDGDDGAVTGVAAGGLDGRVDVRVMALSSVVQVVRSLREWSQPLENEKEHELNQRQQLVGDDGTDLNEEEKRPSIDLNDENEDGEQKNLQATRSLLGSSTSGVGKISEGNDRDTSRFEEALKAKRETAEGIKLFNMKPKRGIEYLIKHGRLNENDKEIAQLLHKTDALDAGMIGEYLGDGNTLNINVMHAYTDVYDFTKMTFDGALRLHLSGFRLPGEAQKIDRIMEKFASRYCECNPNIFANADAAYVLAYSSIMLHTDAHNETIKHKMSKDEFIKNNRGINDGGDLDPTFLGKLYERITTTEIRLSKTASVSTTKDGTSLFISMDSAQRARQFEEESERLLTQSKILFTKKRKPSQDYVYYSANNVHHARLMFDTAWYPILAAVSLNLEQATIHDVKIVPLCLEGFRHGIAISSTFSMDTAKDAFVSSLAKFTHLNSISEMRAKNVECVRMILAIAANEGNHLGEQWVLIVRAVSILEQIRAVVTGNADKYLLQKVGMVGVGNNGIRNASGDGRTSSSSSALATTSLSSPRHSNVVSGDSFKRIHSAANGRSVDDSQKIDAKAAQLAKTVPEGEIERIFTNSSQLSASGVSDFCNALCIVSLEELSEQPCPRIFCLQKIIEMAYYNMDSRTRIQWGKIWEHMGTFFVSAMCHSNRDVAMYAVDALRQLSSKFLEKDELSNFAFQKVFLKPFETCYSQVKAAPIRELVLSCISQIVLARAVNIKSGWKAVFGVLALAADDKVESLMNFGWQIVDSITRKYVGVLDDVYVDAVTGISAYAKTTISTPVSLAAIELLSGRCASSLLDKEDEKDGDGQIGMWFPILTGLAAGMQDDRTAVRLAANNGLFKVLSDHGGRFSPSMWTLVFRGVLSPIFDDVRHLSESNDKNEAALVAEWAATTGVTALQSFVDVFVLHLDAARTILDELLGLIRSWIVQENESVAREGMSILARLVMRAGDVLSSADWKRIIKAVTKTFDNTMPYEIVGSHSRMVEDMEENTKIKEKLQDGKTNDDATANGHDEMRNGHDEMREEIEENNVNGGGKIDFRVVRSKCVVQLLLIEVVQEVIVSFYSKLGTDEIVAMSECLETSYRFAHKFNADVELRYSLWRTGFMNQVPNLLKQETNGLMAYLRIMFWLYLDEERGSVGAWSEERVMELCENVLRRYIHACEEAPSKSEERREVAALSPVVKFIVNSVMQMSERQFGKHLNALYGILLDMVDSCDDREVRFAVTTLLRARVLPSTSTYQAKAQLPGVVATKVLSVKVVADASVQTESELCSAISKVGGVRSVDAIDERPNCFEVVSSAPDEMVIAGAMALSFVKAAFVEVANLHQLD